MAVWGGASIHDAYAELMASSGSIGSWLAMLPQVIAGVAGGYISARAGKRPFVHSLLAGLLFLFFVASMYINPMSQILPGWFTALTFVIPVAASLVGGQLYGRRT
jgi:hypothetical protein